MLDFNQFITLLEHYLCPPGNGVYTVHTAAGNKKKLHSDYYKTDLPDQVQAQWKKNLQQVKQTKLPLMLGVCSDTGGGIHRGANWGPLFIRQKMGERENLKSVFDLGDIRVIPHLLHDKYLNKETIKSCQEALYGEQNQLKVSPLSITEEVCSNLFATLPQAKLLSLGGDHSVSYPLVKAWLEAKNAQNIKCAIIHFDAHTDLLDKRLGIDICFGSWAYHILEYLEKPRNLIQLGIRSSGRPKEYWETKMGVTQYWPADFDSLGSVQICQQIVTQLKEEKIQEVYISFDIDALDEKYACATGTPEPGGLDPLTCVKIIEEIGKNVNVSGADLVEVAPFIAGLSESLISRPSEVTLESANQIIQAILKAMS